MPSAPAAAPNKPYTYTSAYETVRTVGNLLAPEGLEWFTEIPRDIAPTPLIIHLSCMAHYTPHIPFIAQGILRKLGLDSIVVGGPENCCGALHSHFGEPDLADKVALIAQLQFRKARPQKVLSICPDCDEIFAKHGRQPQPYTHHNISELFIEHLDALRALLQPIERRVVVHFHDVNPMRRADADRMLQILRTIPGLEIVEAQHAHGPGIHCQTIHPMPPEDQERMFAEARELGVDTLVVPYHSCYRQHVKMQLKHGVEVHHYLSLMAMALGVPFTEPFKELRLLDDLDAVMAALRPRIERFGYSETQARAFVARAVFC